MASIHQHGDRWRVHWRVDGRQVRESFDTEAEARAAAKKIEARTVLDGVAPDVVDDSVLTLAKWWARWEPGRAWRTSTRETHRVHWQRHIEPVFGRVPIEAITTADVRKFHRALEARKLAPKTVASVHRTLSMALQGAVEDQLLTRNPARDAKLPRTPKYAPVALDVDTTNRLLDAVAEVAPKLDVYARLVGATGMRRAEAAGLTWDRVDVDVGVITVDRQLDYTIVDKSKSAAFCPTKNSKTRRVLLTDATVAMLRAHRVAQVTVLGGGGLVFAQDDGAPWPRVTLQDAWRRAAKKLTDDGAPLPVSARGWHTLRHTVASRLLERGVPPAEVAALIGDSVEVLLSVYTHVTDRDAADKRLRAALE
jgi:integrase